MFDQVFLLDNFETALARQKLVEKQWTSFLSITKLGLGLGLELVLLSFTKFSQYYLDSPKSAWIYSCEIRYVPTNVCNISTWLNAENTKKNTFLLNKQH